MSLLNNNETQYKNSKQRDRILALLRNTETHPTADWLYNKLKPEIPTLSLGTVYRNLRILMEQGKIIRMEHGSGYDRFDANLNPHYHFICKLCGEIIDVKMPNDTGVNLVAEKVTGCKIDEHRIEFFGLCISCKDNPVSHYN